LLNQGSNPDVIGRDRSSLLPELLEKPCVMKCGLFISKEETDGGPI